MKTLAQHIFPARGPNAPGAVVLREIGPAGGMPFATHWRNDQTGGHGGGEYHPTKEDAFKGFDERVKREIECQAAVHGEPAGPYTWEIRGSHKDLGNDDCYMGGTTATLTEAMAELDAARSNGRTPYWGYTGIEGPNGLVRMEVNPSKAPRMDADDGGEFANVQGMAHGVDARNEALGEDVEEPSGPGMR